MALKDQWTHWKRPLFGLIAGLIIGPFVSGFLGWQVTSNTMRDTVDEAIMQQQAEACAYLARQHVKHPEKMEFGPRREVAEKYAKLPWDDSATYLLASRCNDILAEKPLGENDSAS